MDATHYWPFAREYSIWNAALAALQFWMADLEPQTPVMASNRFTQPSSVAHLLSSYGIHWKKYYLVAL